MSAVRLLPSNMRRLREAFNRAGSGRQWLFFNVLGMLSLWGAGLLYTFLIDKPPWARLIDGGQLFLYSLGFLSSSLYVVLKDGDTSTFPKRGLLTGVILILAFACAFLIAGVTLSDVVEGFAPKLAELRWVGFVVLVCSMAVGSIVARLENDRDYFDPQSAGEQRRMRLDRQLDQFGSLE